MALITNLVSYWKMDEGAGNIIDSHGDNDGTNDGADYGAAGIINDALDFEEGNTDYVDVPNHASLNFGTGDFTVAFWMKAETWSGTTKHTPISKGNYSGASAWRGYHFEPAGGGNEGKIYFFVRDVGLLSTTALSAGNWYYIVGVRASGTSYIYVDGTPENDVAAVGDVDETFSFQMGKNPDATYPRYYDGIIDEVAVWNRALDSDEVTELWNSGAGLAYPFTVGNLHMMGANF